MREDGNLRWFNVHITEASLQHTDAGFAHYAFTLSPWTAYPSIARDNYIFHGTLGRIGEGAAAAGRVEQAAAPVAKAGQATDIVQSVRAGGGAAQGSRAEAGIATSETSVAKVDEVAPARGKDGVRVRKGKLEKHKVPCFHPYDKKKFAAMTAPEQKAYLQEMAAQLRRQQDAINSMSATEFKAARDAFQAVGRNPAAGVSQAAYRESFAANMQGQIFDSLRTSGMVPAQARSESISRTSGVMDKLTALHEPDMVAGGWLAPDPKAMGRADVNSSIGGSWPQQGRIDGMDATANTAVSSGRGSDNMNVVLEPCRGKGMR